MSGINEIIDYYDVQYNPTYSDVIVNETGAYDKNIER